MALEKAPRPILSYFCIESFMYIARSIHREFAVRLFIVQNGVTSRELEAAPLIFEILFRTNAIDES